MAIKTIKTEKPSGPLGAAGRSERGPDETINVLYCDVCGAEAPGPSSVDFIGWLDVEKRLSFYDESSRETVCPDCQDAEQSARAIKLIPKYLNRHYGARALQVGNQLRSILKTLNSAEYQIRTVAMINSGDFHEAFDELERLRGYLK